MRDGDQRLGLYPPITPYREGRLAVGGGHDLYFEECGNPRGLPVVIVHGGPGGGVNPTMRRFHDPAVYRIVLYDQRGAGRSVPYGSIIENTTWDLVRDLEALREHLGISHWQLFGGSWGSTLALAYAETHPERVLSLILRGIFLVRDLELRWFYQEGASRIFPEAWAGFLKPIPEAERGDMIAAYARRLFDPDPAVHLPAAQAWSVWEGSTLSLIGDPQRVQRFSDPHFALTFARIECHYFVNRGFLDHDGALLTNAVRLADIPGVIVHGRYDVVTPVVSAVDLAAAWPKAELRIVPDAGHAMTEPGIIHDLIAATQKMSAFVA